MPNEATSFREAVAENLRDVFLGQGHGEETVVYVPHEGTAREITVRVLEATHVYRDETHHRVREHVLKLLVERHAERGIDAPRQGDALYRGTLATLDECVIYDYRELVAEDTVGVGSVLRFARAEISNAGPNIRSPL